MEDEPVLRLLVSGVLESREDVGLTQFTGVDGVKEHAAGIEGPYVLLSDMNLPEPIGGRLVSDLRALPNGTRMTAVVLTASHDVENVRAMAPDADEVIEKPTDVVALAQVIDRVLAQARRISA